MADILIGSTRIRGRDNFGFENVRNLQTTLDNISISSGAQGKYLLRIYQLITVGSTAPAQPSGGSVNVMTEALTPPATWSVTVPAVSDNEILYTSVALYNPAMPTSPLIWSIPYQISGRSGTDGQGFTIRGDWSATTPYNVLDVVDSAGTTYVCTVAHTSVTGEPPASVAGGVNWQELFPARMGAQGEKGDKGDTGEDYSGRIIDTPRFTAILRSKQVLQEGHEILDGVLFEMEYKNIPLADRETFINTDLVVEFNSYTDIRKTRIRTGDNEFLLLLPNPNIIVSNLPTPPVAELQRRASVTTPQFVQVVFRAVGTYSFYTSANDFFTNLHRAESRYSVRLENTILSLNYTPATTGPLAGTQQHIITLHNADVLLNSNTAVTLSFADITDNLNSNTVTYNRYLQGQIIKLINIGTGTYTISGLFDSNIELATGQVLEFTFYGLRPIRLNAEAPSTNTNTDNYNNTKT